MRLCDATMSRLAAPSRKLPQGTGWGIINHDLFLSNAEVLKVIRRSIDIAAA
jgi:hypothetical protein